MRKLLPKQENGRKALWSTQRRDGRNAMSDKQKEYCKKELDKNTNGCLPGLSPKVLKASWWNKMRIPDYVTLPVMVVLQLMSYTYLSEKNYEGPMMTRIVHAMNVGRWNCMAAYSPTEKQNWQKSLQFLDFPNGKSKQTSSSDTNSNRRWVPETNSNQHSSDVRTMCAVYNLFTLLPLIMPNGNNAEAKIITTRTWKELGMDAEVHVGFDPENNFVSDPLPQLKSCTHNDKSLKLVRKCLSKRIKNGLPIGGGVKGKKSLSSNHPKVMGQAIALEIFETFRIDGWNSEGKDSCKKGNLENQKDDGACGRYADSSDNCKYRHGKSGKESKNYCQEKFIVFD